MINFCKSKKDNKRLQEILTEVRGDYCNCADDDKCLSCIAIDEIEDYLTLKEQK